MKVIRFTRATRQYFAGDVAGFPDEEADILIKEGFAEVAEDENEEHQDMAEDKVKKDEDKQQEKAGDKGMSDKQMRPRDTIRDRETDRSGYKTK